MASQPLPMGIYSSAPLPPPPRERRPTIQSSLRANSPISGRPPGTQSPIRRKPLPSTTTPVSPPPITNNNSGPQIFGQVLQHLTQRNQTNGAQIVESPAERKLSVSNRSERPQPQQQSFNYTSPPANLTKSLSHPDSLTRSSTSGTLPRVSTDDFPAPPARDLKPIPPNGALQALVIEEGEEEEEEMALKPGQRPPAPLRTDSTASARSQSGSEQRKPQTPGNKFTSFFSRKQSASPGHDSAIAESEGRSPLPSPYPDSTNSGHDYGFQAPSSQLSQDSIDFDPSAYGQPNPSIDRASILEAELREISRELAGSIKREMDLEDMVEKFQAEVPLTSSNNADRTSDYFSDSGTSSIRPPISDYDPKQEMGRMKRDAEQQRAQMRVDFSHKWQREMATRKAMETQIQYMEQKSSLGKRQENGSQDMSSRVRELERRLNEERQTNLNFEDLLTALRGDLEQHRNDRDNLQDEVVPQLKTRIEGLESSLAEAQKSPYEVARIQHELQSLRDENQALHSARMMNAPFESILEEGGPASPRHSMSGGFAGGLQRSTTSNLGRSNSRVGLNRSSSVSKPNVQELPQNVAEHLKQIEAQRDALHTTVKYLLRRQNLSTKQYEKRLKVAEKEKERTKSLDVLNTPRKGGYEKEVRVLRAEINLLRKRADDAMEQKWDCEKGLAGLKLDLDRSKQETESLQSLLQAKDSNGPEVLSETLENALRQLQQQSVRASNQTSLGALQNDQAIAHELEESAGRSEALAAQVRKQLKTNSGLRDRLKDAIRKGERDQLASAGQISQLQGKLQKLQDTITSAQIQSETAVMKHEEEVRLLRASTNIQLMRGKLANTNILSPTARSPLSPLFPNGKRSPRLDKTTSGPGMGLHQALKTEYLENKVSELEKALNEAENEMGEVIGRMNTAQIGVAELEAERDEALRQTRKLEEKVRMLVGGLSLPRQQ